MLFSSEGIVLRNIRFSETSVIAKIYTRERGMLSFYIPGVYKKNPAVKPAYLQPMQLLSLNFYFRENRSLHRIREARAVTIPGMDQGGSERPVIALFMAELIQKVVVEEEANNNLFDFICQALGELAGNMFDNDTFVIYFLLKFSRFLGFYPVSNLSPENLYFDMAEGKFSPVFKGTGQSLGERESKCFSNILVSENTRFEFREEGLCSRNEMIDILLHYYNHHVPNFGKMKSAEIMKI